jgi:putative mycofactocin binding protein MftB
MTFDATKPYRLDPRVALRPEDFGALAYHYGNRRLTLLRAPELVALVRDIDRFPSARAAYDGVGIADRRWSSFEKALTSLERSGFLTESDGRHRRRPTPGPSSRRGSTPRSRRHRPAAPPWPTSSRPGSMPRSA